MQNPLSARKLHRFFLLSLTLALFRPPLLSAQTLAPLTRTTLEAVPKPSSVLPAPAALGEPGEVDDDVTAAGEPADDAAADPAAADPAPAAAVGPDCLSIGEPSRGRLVNGQALTTDPTMLVRSDENYGTPETVEGIRRAVADVVAQFPNGHRIVVGDLSKERGGRIRPHRSHQSGRDADLGYYVQGSAPPNLFVPVKAENIDLARNWALVQSFVTRGGVQYIFMDRRVQKLLRAYAAEEKKIPEATLNRIFEYPGRGSLSALVRHRRGHRNHMHVRFFSPVAVAAGVKNGPAALAALAPPATAAGAATGGLEVVRTFHRVKKGDTLARIAQRYRVGVSDLLRWNRLKVRTTLQLGQGIAVVRKVRTAVAPPPKDVCHAGPRGAVGCWRPSRT